MELKGHLLYYPEGKHDINLDNYIQKSQLNDALKSKVDPITKTTYADLKNLRDNSQLVPGAIYRITDYQCTTTQENTQSAGHQFDIVLLALSNNKLAEEGWAMMNESNIYDVTFTDGVTKKCWIYDNGPLNPLAKYNVVNTETLKGFVFAEHAIQIDKENKTASLIAGYDSTSLDELDDLTYNYFQNSNLSAWKVWYCLDNDKSRFAWADDSVDEDSPASIEVILSEPLGEYTFERKIDSDLVVNNIQYYAWGSYSQSRAERYTLSETPSEEDNLYYLNKKGTMTLSSDDSIVSFTPAHEGTGLQTGRGVIYRLIDEWNNDVGYDFKNIQFVRKLTDGELDTSTGTDTWVYTFNGWDGDNSACVDATTDITLGFNDTHNNIPSIYSLGDNVFLGECYYIKIMDNNCSLITLSNCLSTTLIATFIFELADENGAIYIGNKKVLTEE